MRKEEADVVVVAIKACKRFVERAKHEDEGKGRPRAASLGYASEPQKQVQLDVDDLVSFTSIEVHD